MRRPYKNIREYKKIKRELLGLYLEADRLLKEIKTAISKKVISDRLDHIFFLIKILEQKLIRHLISRNISIKRYI